MRILHLSTWSTGGAAIAARRLSDELEYQGIASQVSHMSSKLPAYIDAAIGKLAIHANPIFHSYNYFGENISQKIAGFKPDILHIHWIGAGFIRPESLKQFNLPIVWSLHDLWPLCGAEHLPGSSRFQKGYLKNNRPDGESRLDLDRIVWERKTRALQDLNISFVAPSHYVYNLAKTAKILGNHNLTFIPNGLDTNIFHADSKNKSNTILFIANNPHLDLNKGYADFKLAIGHLPPILRSSIQIKVITGGIKSDQDLASIYSNALLTVVPSKLETLSYVTMESMSCGTPVVAYRVGGIPDLVEHDMTGYLAKPSDTKDLAKGIVKILSDPNLSKKYSRTGRKKIITGFDISSVAKKHIALYQSLI